MSLELADIMRRFGPLYLQRFSTSMPASHQRALLDIQRCRTEAMGGHVYQCDDCGKRLYVYHGCRNRNCPACHREQTSKWLNQRTSELLPRDYFHVTVTLPQTLRAVFRSNQRALYSLLMRTASDALIQLADDAKHLGARVGILAVLHTWAGHLTYHPHVHLLVTGGGVDQQGQWVACKNKYLVPVKALSKLIRGKLAAQLKKDYPDLHQQVTADTWIKDWVVHSIHYPQGSKAVLNYLGRYVFRIAITNNRILSMDHTHVTFKYKDRRAGKWKTQKLLGCEFLRRYLQHVLPKGFHKVRYYGLWHPSSKHNVKKLICSLAVAEQMSEPPSTLSPQESTAENAQDQPLKCPHCGSEQLHLMQTLPRPRARSPSMVMVPSIFVIRSHDALR
jgi:hypothetical protein